MNGVKFVGFRILLFVLLLTSTFLSHSKGAPQTKKGLGISSCSYFGYTNCSQLSVEKLPKECTSFLWDGLLADIRNNVDYAYTDNKGGLDLLLNTGKPVYVYYGHRSMQLWTYVFGCDGCEEEINVRAVMKALKAYMKAHPGIKGLIVSDFESDEDLMEYPGFTKSLVTYIKIMRETFPDLEISMLINGKYVIDNDVNPKMKWLDLKVLNTLIDFFVVTVSALNECSLDSRVDGTAPVNGSSKYTMTNLNKSLQKKNIPKEKLYYTIKLTVTTTDPDINTWDATYQQICIHPDEASDVCVENTLSYYQKGQFIKANAAGFVGSNVDLADPKDDCKCGRPFAPFYDVLDGFNDKIAPKSCKAMDSA